MIYSVAASLDGFVARPDGSTVWLGPYMASGDDYMGPFIDSMGCVARREPHLCRVRAVTGVVRERSLQF
ncbi:MAG: hypothetical protein ACRDJ4_06400 [Actinomycetota bacterium]